MPAHQFLLTDGAIEYLKELGVPQTKNSMDKHASLKTGPRYVLILGRRSYTKPWLDEWVERLIVEPGKAAA